MEKVNSMGMELDNWKHKSCEAMVGVGDDWATIYIISSSIKRKGHATELLKGMKKHYESKDKIFGSSVTLSNNMKHLLQKLNIVEYI